jgi:hypothetical protein
LRPWLHLYNLARARRRWREGELVLGRLCGRRPSPRFHGLAWLQRIEPL